VLIAYEVDDIKRFFRGGGIMGYYEIMRGLQNIYLTQGSNGKTRSGERNIQKLPVFIIHM
jgi:hypothetical protein